MICNFFKKKMFSSWILCLEYVENYVKISLFPIIKMALGNVHHKIFYQFYS